MVIEDSLSFVLRPTTRSTVLSFQNSNKLRTFGKSILYRMTSTLPAWPHKAGSGPEIRVGVIGGSGLYKLEGIELVGEVEVKTVSRLESTRFQISIDVYDHDRLDKRKK